MPWDLRQFRRKHKFTKAHVAQRLRISEPQYKLLESLQSLVPEPLPNHVANCLNNWQRELSGKVRKMPDALCPLHNCPLRPLRKPRAKGTRWLSLSQAFPTDPVPDREEWWSLPDPEDWWLRREGKMKRWWAKCVIGGEILVVRADGDVQNPPTRERKPRSKRGKLKGRPRGRPPKAESEKRNFLIGGEVEMAQRNCFEGFMAAKRLLPKKTRARTDLLVRALLAVGFSREELKAGLVARRAITAARRFIAALRNLDFRTVARYHREYLSSVSL